MFIYTSSAESRHFDVRYLKIKTEYKRLFFNVNGILVKHFCLKHQGSKKRKESYKEMLEDDFTIIEEWKPE